MRLGNYQDGWLFSFLIERAPARALSENAIVQIKLENE